MMNLIILSNEIGIFLPVDKDLLAAGLIFKTQLVVTFALMGFGAQHGFGLVIRQRIRRFVTGMIGSARHDRLIRVAVEKRHHHFMAHPRDHHGAVLRPRPALRDTDPARALIVGVAVSVPRKMQLHPAKFITVNLFAVRADHGGNTRAVHLRGRLRHRAPDFITGDEFKLVRIGGCTGAAAFFQCLWLTALMAGRHHNPVAVHCRVKVVADIKMQPGLKAWLVTFTGRGVIFPAQGIKADLGKGFAVAIVFKPAGMVEVFVGFQLVDIHRFCALLKAVAGLFEAVILHLNFIRLRLIMLRQRRNIR
ncbi:hypothetical protein VIAE108258_22090 [Vibrio aerogenes]